jgi:hypothetical protein
MGYEAAYHKARKGLEGINPYVVASMSGASFEDGKFIISFFNRSFFIHYPVVKVEEVSSDTPLPQWLEILLMHYLLTADGTPVSDMWINYRHLPGAQLFERRFDKMAIGRLTRTFGDDVERFRRACLSIGGIPMSRSGDAAFRFLALPKIPIGCVLYLGDEDVHPSVVVLFDSAASHYLPTEDLSLLGTYLATSLIKS